MPANTAKGYPYPLGTDRVMDGDDSIKSLAEAVDTKAGLVQRGGTNIPIVAANTTASIAITFPVPFPAGVTPIVVLSVGATAHSPGSIALWVSSGATNTGFTANGQRSNTSQIPFNWIASG